jgi:hypothetical protein
MHVENWYIFWKTTDRMWRHPVWTLLAGCGHFPICSTINCVTALQTADTMQREVMLTRESYEWRTEDWY